jgi:endonuclease
MRRFYAVVREIDGSIGPRPMKQWLRQNADRIPPGLDPTSSTSHQLRDGLKKLGWTVRDTPTEVWLIMPGVAVPADDRPEEEVDGEDDAFEAGFALEYQLRDFIADNLSALIINGRRLHLYVDPSGRRGIEFRSAVGPIDILAVDDNGGFYVLELKRAHSPDRAIGQLTRYMGWVRQTIGKGRAIHGVIVAKEIGNNLRYAVLMVPNVSLFEYEVQFNLKPAHGLPDGAAP